MNYFKPSKTQFELQWNRINSYTNKKTTPLSLGYIQVYSELNYSKIGDERDELPRSNDAEGKRVVYQSNMSILYVLCYQNIQVKLRRSGN